MGRRQPKRKHFARYRDWTGTRSRNWWAKRSDQPWVMVLDLEGPGAIQTPTASDVDADPGDPWGESPQYGVWVRLGRSETGRILLTGVHIEVPDEEELTSRALQRLPLGALFRGAIDTSLPTEWGPTLALERTPRRRLKRGPKGYSDDFFRGVARDWKELVKTQPRSPTTALADLRGASVATARRWLAAAEERGFLDRGGK